VNFISQGFFPDVDVILFETCILLVRKALFIIDKITSDLHSGINTLKLKNYQEFVNSKNQFEIVNLFTQQKNEMTHFLTMVSSL
jgi:hypothetical protein